MMKFWKSPAWMRRVSDIRAQISAGNAARLRGDWKRAAATYAAVALTRPHDHFINMKLGEARRNSGDLEGAVTAFEAAVSVRPWRPEGHLQLGRTLKLAGRMDDAIAALTEASELSKAYPLAQRALLELGLRLKAASDDLPPDVNGGAAAAVEAARIQYEKAKRDCAALTTFPPEAWDAFRKACPVSPPPDDKSRPCTNQQVIVVVDAAHSAPAYLRSTLLSLLHQRHGAWQAVVLTDREMAAHSVAALAEIDARIVFQPAEGLDLPAAMSTVSHIVSITSGVVLDPSALDWLTFAARRTGAAVVYSDHDSAFDHWRRGRSYHSPVLQAVADPFDIAGSTFTPAAILIAASLAPVLFAALRVHEASPSVGAQARRAVLLHAARTGAAAHVPMTLASVLELPEVAARGLAAESEGGLGFLQPVISARAQSPVMPSSREARICMVVPTRDQAKLLEACLRTAKSTAAQSDRLTIVVVDNRSTTSDAIALMRSQKRAGAIEIFPADMAFNWSRLNNLATVGVDHEILVFANNDVEFLTLGWDDRLRDLLEDDEVGAVGARLLYPDRCLQHAGIVLGAGDGPPIHEGVGFSEAEGGALDRWSRTRSAAAVTGAFLALRRAVFEEVGGFDEIEFSIAYNDIDFSMRVRESGRLVVFDAAIELIHRESASRGFNDTKARVAWDQGELSSLHRRWGDAMLFDPSVNPQWASAAHDPFSGYRRLSEESVLKHIDASGKTQPWRVARRSE